MIKDRDINARCAGAAPAPSSSAPAPCGAYEPVPDAVDEGAPLPPGASRVPCERIDEVLFSYMVRELGPGQSLLVREHLRRCPKCRAQALEIRRTIDILEARDPAAAAPDALSPRRRRRVFWTFAHPVLDFIFVHHAIASLAVSAAVIAIVLWLLLTRITDPSPLRVFWVNVSDAPASQSIEETQPQEDSRGADIPQGAIQ